MHAWAEARLRSADGIVTGLCGMRVCRPQQRARGCHGRRPSATIRSRRSGARASHKRCRARRATPPLMPCGAAATLWMPAWCPTRTIWSCGCRCGHRCAAHRWRAADAGARQVDGEMRQKGHTAQMIFTIPKLIEHIRCAARPYLQAAGAPLSPARRQLHHDLGERRHYPHGHPVGRGGCAPWAGY